MRSTPEHKRLPSEAVWAAIGIAVIALLGAANQVLLGGLAWQWIGRPTVTAVLHATVGREVELELRAARRRDAEADLRRLHGELIEHAVQPEAFPESLSDPEVPGAMAGRRVAGAPRDAWGHPYSYEPPAGARRWPRIVCFGEDGQPGGIGPATDFTIELSEPIVEGRRP